MYGKLFERMYTGSMMGCGAMMFAVWPYVIAHMKPNRDRSIFTVELNTQLMALLIGESEEDIAKIIAQFCEPDLKSRTPDKEGRKLVKLGTYLYEVVNGSVYDEIRREAELRESNRRRQERHYYKNAGALVEISPKPEVSAPEPPKKSPEPPRENFTKPTIEEVRLAAAKLGLSELEANKFFSYYEANGWRVGKNPMKNWSHALSGWKMRSNEYGGNKNGGGPGKPNPRNFGIATAGPSYGDAARAKLERQRMEREMAEAGNAGSTSAGTPAS